MAESSELLCESCQYEHVTKSASQWCTDCEEGFCSECSRGHKAAKMSRNHHTITSVEYQKTKQFNVNLRCTDHSKQLDFYCPTHDNVVCVECVQLHHGGCKDLRSLDEAAKNSKTSTAFTDLEQTIEGLLENIENGALHLQQNKTNFQDEEEVAKKFIATKRSEINKHLDRLEEKLLKVLKSKSEKVMKEISLTTTKLETKRKNISDLKDTAQNMKQFSSNLQVFVGIRSILKTVVNEINGIKLLLSSIPQISVAVQINPKFETFNKAFDSLGEIQITSKEAVVPYVERGLIQAQYQRPTEQPVHKIDNLQLKLRTNIKMGKINSKVTSCLILPNKSIMIACNNKLSLTILKEDGSHDRDISVPYNPSEVTMIDDQRVAVSYGKTMISIVNINTQNINQTLENLCRQIITGITYSNGKLFALAQGEGIKVIDLDGNIIKTILAPTNTNNLRKVTTQKNEIYYSANGGSVHCVDMEGTEIWECQDGRLLYYPGIAVDNYGITFAACYISNLLLAISPDGKQQKVLLTSSDGLQNPEAVFYDKDSKRLLVCNYNNGHAALYDVIY